MLSRLKSLLTLNCASCVAILPDFVSGIVFGIVFDDYARKLRLEVTSGSYVWKLRIKITYESYVRKLRTKVTYENCVCARIKYKYG